MPKIGQNQFKKLNLFLVNETIIPPYGVED